jgi:FtsH-binding integral membrane protein
MATTIAHPETPATTAPQLPGRRFDHLFFSGMSLLMLATVFVGFAHTYYLAGVFHAPLPSLIIHVHGAAFSCWVLLLLTQTSLVSAGRVDIHRRLGIAGFVLACLMVVLGVLAATDSLVREAGAARRDPRFFYIIPLTDMLVFATLVYFAFRNRFNAAAHKRLILIATTGLIIAAIARWPWAFVHRQNPKAALIVYLYLLILVAYDLWSTHKVHRATLWGSAFLIFVYQIRLVIGKTEAWLAFAGWVQGMAR